MMITYFDETGQEHQKPDNTPSQWRVSGYAIVQSEKGEILMVQPAWNTTCWELPGGGIEKGESIREGIARECYEETGYKITVNDQPIWVGERNFYSKALDIFFNSIILVYTGQLLNNIQNKEMINTVEKNEIAKAEWVKSETLSESNVHPIAWPAIRKIKSV